MRHLGCFPHGAISVLLQSGKVGQGKLTVARLGGNHRNELRPDADLRVIKNDIGLDRISSRIGYQERNTPERENYVCGGVFDLKKPVDPDILHHMTNMMSRRGPEKEGGRN